MVARSRRNTECRNWRDHRGQCETGDRRGRGFHRGVVRRLVTSGWAGSRRAAIVIALLGAFAPAALATPTLSNPAEVQANFDAALAAFNTGNYTEALRQAQVAANLGNSDAAVMAGYILRNGQTGRADMISARGWFERAAALRNPDAYVALGEMGVRGQGGLTRADAVAWLTRASDAGRTDAMRALADLHRTGEGTSQDAAESQRLLTKASQSFDAEATKRLGDQLLESDAQAALAAYEKAARAGHVEAAYAAGVMYAENFDIRPDSDASARWLKQAAEGGHAAAQADYGLLVYQGYGATQSDTDAAAWFRKSAEGGDTEGQFLYAFTLAKGEGAAQNYEGAYYWILRSIRGSDALPEDPYAEDKSALRDRLEANVDPAILARARTRLNN